MCTRLKGATWPVSIQPIVHKIYMMLCGLSDKGNYSTIIVVLTERHIHQVGKIKDAGWYRLREYSGHVP